MPITLLLPPLRRALGRPKKNKRREADEETSSTQTVKSAFRCSFCKFYNKRACKRAPVRAKSGGNKAGNKVFI